MAKAEAEHIFGESEPTRGQIILHVDLDCFFAACERLRSPELRGEPVVIGGGFDSAPPRGAVATASYEAREYGVESAQPMAVALKNLSRRAETDDDTPSGYYLKGDHSYYKSISADVMSVIRDHASTVRVIGIDEAYLDVTQATAWDDVEAFAQSVRADIESTVGVVASIGAAPTMSCAKIASDYNKPDGLCIVEPGTVESFLAPLEIDEIHGVGPVSAERFRDNGIDTAGDLAALSPQEVIDRFGTNTKNLYDRVRGIDDREVSHVGKPKSISKEKSIEATDDGETKEALIRTLSGQVAERAQAKGARYLTIGIKVVETPFDVNTRETSLHGPIDDPELLQENALRLLREFRETEVRKLGVRVSNLDFSPGEQIRFDDWTPPDWIIATDDADDGANDQRSGQTRLLDFI